MAITVVASTQARFHATSSAIDTTGATLLVAVDADYNFGTLGPISDSKGNTWIPRTTYGAGGPKVKIFYCENPTVGSGHTFTCSGDSNGIAIIAVNGTTTSSVYDKESGADATSPGSITPNEDNEILIAGMCAASGSGYSVDSGFTLQESRAYNAGDNTMGFGLAYLIQTTATAKNPVWTGGATVTNIASFKAVSSGGGGPTNVTRQIFLPYLRSNRRELFNSFIRPI